METPIMFSMFINNRVSTEESNSSQLSSTSSVNSLQPQQSTSSSGPLTNGQVNRCFPFTIGEKIKVIAISVDQLRSLRQNHNRTEESKEAQFIDKIGTVNRIGENGEVIVQFDDSQIVWSSNFSSKKGHVDHQVDDVVQVIDDENEMKKLQRGHGEFLPEMSNYLGFKGVIVNLFTDGDLRVAFDGGTWILNPDCVINLSAIEREKSTSAAESTVPEIVDLESSDQETASSSSTNLENANNPTPFTVGDQVKVISVSSNVLKAIHLPPSIWNPQMSQFIGKTGIVIKVIDKHNVTVKFDSSRKQCTFSPVALVKHYIGDLIKVNNIKEQETVESLLVNENYSVEMFKIIGSTGIVIDAENNGDFIINLRGQIWTLNPSCVTNLSEIVRSKKSVDTMAKKQGVYTWKDWIDQLAVIGDDSRPVTTIDSRDHLCVKSDEDTNITVLVERQHLLESKMRKFEEENTCGICWINEKKIIFSCGHGACSDCADIIEDCHLCRASINEKISMY
ncbi:E3 ubiquitin-protein ligase mib1-like [Panonychus citri]|uniref:E3 ubiquitin-protein ligase mib1-like n=1 Tax=Panonychus citri TaxID=50023 RepID=UPI002307CAEC|nr:E3 ubiquitin-protein ligase mib1-like [Panonychus citri]